MLHNVGSLSEVLQNLKIIRNVNDKVQHFEFSFKYEVKYSCNICNLSVYCFFFRFKGIVPWDSWLVFFIKWSFRAPKWIYIFFSLSNSRRYLNLKNTPRFHNLWDTMWTFLPHYKPYESHNFVKIVKYILEFWALLLMFITKYNNSPLFLLLRDRMTKKYLQV